MAKKSKIAQVIGGIVGTPQPRVETEELSQSAADQMNISAELLEAINKERTQNAGRPRKSDVYSPKRGTKKSETRATFIVNEDTLRKVKYISVLETRMIKDLVADALDAFICKWESENGEIDLKKFKG